MADRFSSPPVTDTIYMGHVVRYSQRKDDTRRQPRTAPITNVHIDVPLEDAPKFIRPLLRDRADELLGKRFMIINVGPSIAVHPCQQVNPNTISIDVATHPSSDKRSSGSLRCIVSQPL